MDLYWEAVWPLSPSWERGGYDTPTLLLQSLLGQSLSCIRPVEVGQMRAP